MKTVKSYQDREIDAGVTRRDYLDASGRLWGHTLFGSGCGEHANRHAARSHADLGFAADPKIPGSVVEASSAARPGPAKANAPTDAAPGDAPRDDAPRTLWGEDLVDRIYAKGSFWSGSVEARERTLPVPAGSGEIAERRAAWDDLSDAYFERIAAASAAPEAQEAAPA